MTFKIAASGIFLKHVTTWNNRFLSFPKVCTKGETAAIIRICISRGMKKENRSLTVGGKENER